MTLQYVTQFRRSIHATTFYIRTNNLALYLYKSGYEFGVTMRFNIAREA